MSWRGGGVRTFVMQRLTAVYIAIFTIFFVVHMVSDAPVNYDQWRMWIATPLVNIAFLCFWLSIGIHGWIGARDVIMDYVGDTGTRFLALSLAGLFLVFMVLWLFKTLIMVGA
ncbi:MAG: succinate dehydrogenase, hydrophobic membrane anchor protein [Gammaproteobacteria bacterium]|nr:succinate dehydrogenase, hydrophobic membrane anchor protein [Gammaproteobacteria bacterium]